MWFWRGATKVGAALGLGTGFLIWLYCLFLPSFGPDAVLSAGLIAEGPAGLSWLRHRASLRGSRPSGFHPCRKTPPARPFWRRETARGVSA